jgi:TPR repeat protein
MTRLRRPVPAVAVLFGLAVLAGTVPADAETAEQAMVRAMAHIEGTDGPVSYARAAEAFEVAAGAGDADAQNWLGRLLFEGLGVERDPAAALERFAAAASQGRPDHVYDYARALEATAVDDAALGHAARLYRQAADTGHAEAQASLGVMLYEGRGVAPDPDAARALFERAAEAGNARALNNLGLLYARGDAVAQDHARAADLFAAAAEAGSPDALRNLGVMYENGFGVPLDEALAHRLYREAGGKGGPAETDPLPYDPRLAPPGTGPEDVRRRDRAAEAGDPVAAFQRAWLALSPDPDAAAPTAAAEARADLAHAADAGYPPAMILLAVLLEAGIGVPQDWVAAQAWLLRAAAAGAEGADARAAALEARMTPAQIASAQDRAAR